MLLFISNLPFYNLPMDNNVVNTDSFYLINVRLPHLGPNVVHKVFW